MKDKILKLRDEGKSYSEIQKLLNCSKGTISFHCGPGQKEKSKNRLRKQRKHIPIRRLQAYKYQSSKQKRTIENLRKFKTRNDNNVELNFTLSDIYNKFGHETICYLSGEKINLITDEFYSFDHILPVARGGNNELENLGITHTIVNRMKCELTNDEFIHWCKKILEHNNYTVTRV